MKSLVFRLLLLAIGGLAGIAVFVAIFYFVNDISDMPYNCALGFTYLRFGFALIFLAPFYILMYYIFAYTRKAWWAFVVGVLWFPLQFINQMTCDHPYSILVSLSSFALTGFVDCLIVVAISWTLKSLLLNKSKRNQK
jgi:hypothetical protein